MKNNEKFLYQYLNNASPTGFEVTGQQIWLDYLKPYIDEQIVDVYGTAVGVINPESPTVWQLRLIPTKSVGL